MFGDISRIKYLRETMVVKIFGIPTLTTDGTSLGTPDSVDSVKYNVFYFSALQVANAGLSLLYSWRKHQVWLCWRLAITTCSGGYG